MTKIVTGDHADPATKKYPVELLKDKEKRPNDVNQAKKEMYLSEADFETVFGMTMAKYGELPGWKKSNEKKRVGLF